MLPLTLITMVFMALFSLLAFSAPEAASAQTMCTMDAMQCPDGTWVGRSGPNCEFVCGGDTSDNDGTYTNWPGTEYPEGSAEASFGSNIFYSIGNFFSGFFDWFNW